MNKIAKSIIQQEIDKINDIGIHNYELSFDMVCKWYVELTGNAYPTFTFQHYVPQVADMLFPINILEYRDDNIDYGKFIFYTIDVFNYNERINQSSSLDNSVVFNQLITIWCEKFRAAKFFAEKNKTLSKIIYKIFSHYFIK